MSGDDKPGETQPKSTAVPGGKEKKTKEIHFARPDNKILSFHLFSSNTYATLLQKEEQRAERRERRLSKQQSAHLVDGELIFGDDDEEDEHILPDPNLREGNLLLENYGIFPSSYFGKPIEEIDNGIKDKTFVVISKRMGKRYINRFSATKSFFIFPPWNSIRKAAVFIATNQFFDYFIILTILTNCVFLAMPNMSFADKSEYVFLAIYTLEMFVKLVARGFFIDSYTYLRDPWNWLDFIVIVSAFLTLTIQLADKNLDFGNLQGLRTFRVLRALRTVSIIPGLKTIVGALLRAFKMLVDVILLILFCLMVFALFALQVYNGVLRQKCVLNIENFTPSLSMSYDAYYNEHIRNSSNWYLDRDGNYMLCGNISGSGSCPENYTCLPNIDDNPNFGYTSFDHFGWAMLNSFQLLTLDFWEDTYDKIIRATGPWNLVYFVMVIFFGSFYLINLMLAVVAMSYEEEALHAGKERERELNAKQKKKVNPVYEIVKLTVVTKRASTELKHAMAQRTAKTLIEKHKMKAGEKPVDPVNPLKPMVKKVSKDSGYSSKSQTSGKSWKSDSHEQLTIDVDAEASGSGSGSGVKTSVNTFIKQESLPNSKAESSKYVKQGRKRHKRHGKKSSTDKPKKKKKFKRPSSVRYDHLRKSEIENEIDTEVEKLIGISSFNDEFSEDEEENTKSRSLINRMMTAVENIISSDVDNSKKSVESNLSNIVNSQKKSAEGNLNYIVNSQKISVESNLNSTVNNPKLSASSIQEEGSNVNNNSLCSDVEKGKYTVVKAEVLEDWDATRSKEILIDRNCQCCQIYCLCFISWLKIENMLYTIIADPIFDLFITTCIALNTIIMATEHYGQSYALEQTLKISNYIFTLVFTVEATLKITALNKWYFKSGWNLFDLTIVIAGLVDLALEDIDGLSVIRIFRLLRVFKLAQSWPTMRILLSIILNTLGALANLTVVLGIILYIFAVIGLQLFNTKYTEEKFYPDPPPRWNFNDFGHAIVMVFRVLCGEWIEPLWDCMRAADELCMVVFLPTLVLGNFIVLNLFLALLLNAFASDTLGKNKDINELNKFRKAWDRIKKLCCCKSVKNVVEPTSENKDDDTDKIQIINECDDEQPSDSVEMKIVANGHSKTDKKLKESEKDSHAKRSVKFEDVDDLELGASASTLKSHVVVNVDDCFPKILSKRLKCLEAFDRTTFGQRWNAFRKFLLLTVDHKIFETSILIIIFASSITLAFEDVYLVENVELMEALHYVNIIFAVLFSIEMILKWFAYGLTKYFTNFWTLLDFVIVVISVASLISELLGISNLTAFRSLRTLRALRPLRAISRWQGMKIVVNALMMAIPAIVNVLLVCIVFWLIFSIMGVQFFAGKFYKCLDDSGNKLPPSIVANKTECSAKNFTWKNSNVNFDSVLSGYLALFQVATFEGWMEIMEDAIDATGVDKQPSAENGFYYYFYFIIFIIFGSFFTLNLFIGVIIDNFNVLKKKYDGSYLDMLLTPSQRNYYNTMKKLGNKKPQKTIKRPKWKFQAYFFDIATNTKFELVIVFMIFLNMIVMSIEHYNQSIYITDILNIMNMVFTTIFTLEVVVKLIGMRWHYFRQAWNVFDFIIVVLSLVGIVLKDFLVTVVVTPTLLRVVRIFRIGRVLRLIKAAKGIRKLLFALIISLPAIINIGALLFLLLYIYAIIGMSSFGNVKITGSLNDIVNFQTFFSSFMLMLRLSTSAGWNDILEPLLIRPPYCDPDHKTLPNGTKVPDNNGDCGIPWLAVPFMVSYIIIIFLIVINMYIAVILENFNQAHQQEEVGITEDDFDMFYSVWEKYDPHATQFIKYEQLQDFVADLDEPLGHPKPNEIALVAFNLPIVEGDKTHCIDILIALVKSFLGEVDETNEFKELKSQIEKKFQEVFPSRVNMAVISTTMQRKKEDVAARTLQKAWKHFKTQRMLKNITSLAMQQNLTRTSSTDARQRASSIFSLGRRLSTALTSFFTSSRPSSAGSHDSHHDSLTVSTAAPIGRKNITKNTLQIPAVTPMYGEGSSEDKFQL